MFKYTHDDLPNVFKGMFLYGHDIHSHDTRQASALRAPPFKLNITKSSICYRGAVLWNNLEKSIQSIPTISSFKSQCKKILIQRLEIETESIQNCQCWVCKRPITE